MGFFAVAIPMASASRPFSIVAILEEPARRREGLTNAPALANSVAAPGQPAAAPEAPLLGSLNLTPAPLLYDSSGNGVINADDKEQYQTEISTTVSLAGRMFVISSGGGPTLQVSDATNAAEISLVARSSLNGYTSQSVASYGNLLAVALSPSDYATNGGKGLVRFYRVEADGTLTQLQDVEVGYQPDSPRLQCHRHQAGDRQ